MHIPHANITYVLVFYYFNYKNVIVQALPNLDKALKLKLKHLSNRQVRTRLESESLIRTLTAGDVLEELNRCNPILTRS